MKLYVIFASAFVSLLCPWNHATEYVDPRIYNVKNLENDDDAKNYCPSVCWLSHKRGWVGEWRKKGFVDSATGIEQARCKCIKETPSLSVKKDKDITTFESDRLMYKLSKMDEKNKIIRIYMGDPTGLKFWSGGDEMTREELKANIESRIDQNKFLNQQDYPLQMLTWSVFDKSTKELLGTVGANKVPIFEGALSNDEHKLIKGGAEEAFYYINLDRFFKLKAQGQGFGTEACKAVVAHIFDTTHETYIVAGSLKENKASQESQKKCGFVRLGEVMHKGHEAILSIKKKATGETAAGRD